MITIAVLGNSSVGEQNISTTTCDNITRRGGGLPRNQHFRTYRFRVLGFSV